MIVAGVALAGCGSPAPGMLRPDTAPTTAAIEAEDLRIRVGILADDSLRGRETGSPGAAAVAGYLAAELTRMGFTPAGDGDHYLQRVPLERSRTLVSVSATVGDSSMSLGLDQLIPISGIAGLPDASRQSGGGSLIFGGHLVDPTVGSDELTLEQLTDAIVIVRLSLPSGVDPDAASPRVPMATLFSPASPASAVMLVAEEPEAALWEYATEIAVKGELSLPTTSPGDPTAPPFFLISEETAERLIGSSLSDARQPKTGLGSVAYTIVEQADSVEAWNVAGILPGNDPSRAEQYIGLGGHYDHVGVGTPVNGDSIYNGADDNASGTAVLLEVAEALAALSAEQRPARSMLFVWNTAEESGLLGSEYFTDNPTVPRESIVAHLNLDMVGRNSPDSLLVVGASRLSTELGEVVESVNRQMPRPFVLDYSFDPEGHPEQIYCRSDHYNYARYGIPIVFLTSGLHDDYHAPSDEASKLDYGKLDRVGEFVFGITTELANRATSPTIDKPIPPLGAPCS